MAAVRRALVVDDDPSIRLVLHVWLLTQAVEVEEAEDLPSAILRARKQRFDLLLVDLVLQNGDGHLLARALRREHPHLCLVLMTAYPLQMIDLPLGAADDYAAILTKPFDIAALEAALSPILEPEDEESIPLVLGPGRSIRDVAEAVVAD